VVVGNRTYDIKESLSMTSIDLKGHFTSSETDLDPYREKQLMQ